MTTTKQTFLLTDSGIHETTTDFSSFVAITNSYGVHPFLGTPILTPIGSDSLNIGCVTHDIKLPMFWYGNSNLFSWKLFDPVAGATKLYTSVVADTYIRASQFDQMTNRTFFLTAFREEVDFSKANETIYNGNIASYEPITKTESRFIIKIKVVPTSILYALDMKIDPVRRNIWILDAGNSRILRCNIDTGEVDRLFSLPNTSTPCSMTIDINSGNTYIRCLNQLTETIYMANDDGITPLVETVSSVEYDSKWLRPSSKDLSDIITSGEPIPLPASDSMKVDPLRGKLWWISKSSECTVYMMDVNNLVMNSILLETHLDSILAINLDRDSGNAIVCGSKGSYGKIVVLDKTVSVIASHQHIDSSSVNNVMIMEPEFGNCLPFYVTGQAGSSNVESSSSSIQNPVDVTTINNSLIAEDESDLTVFTNTPYVDIRIWGQENSGVSSVKTWTAKNANSSSRLITKAISTPKFSWSSTVKSGKAIIVVATKNGDLIKIQFDNLDKKMTEVGRCLKPVGSNIEGLSVSNGNSNVYVSGSGSIVRINLDPNTMAVDSEDESSESSSQSGEDSNYSIITVSQILKESEVGGLSVQFQNSSNEMFSVSKQECMLILSSGLDGWENRKTYSPLPSPFKAIWSKQHNGVLVAGKYTIHLVNLQQETIQLIYAVPKHYISDICIKDGKIGVAVTSAGGSEGLFKVIGANLSSNLLMYSTSGEFPSASCFLTTDIVLIALENNTNDIVTTRFVAANLNGGIQESSTETVGKVKSLFLDENYNVAIAVFESGKVISLSLDSSNLPIVTIIGEINEEVLFANGSLLSSQGEAVHLQKKIRVFVGSSDGTSDRWDSGEVETDKQEILYGGGDNLESGEAYWVSISVMDDIYGWSEPVSKLFVAPIM